MRLNLFFAHASKEIELAGTFLQESKKCWNFNCSLNQAQCYLKKTKGVANLCLMLILCPLDLSMTHAAELNHAFFASRHAIKLHDKITFISASECACTACNSPEDWVGFS